AEQSLARADRVRTVTADIAQSLRVVAVDLDPEHLKIGNRPKNLQIALGLGVEVEIEQQIDIRTGAVADCFKMITQIAQHRFVDIQLGDKGNAKPGPPAARHAVIIGKYVGLQRGKALVADLAADRSYSVEAGDGGLVKTRMIDAPGCAMRPVN